eukprot:1155916-Pelagomonas_calceolata.AAC.10
MMRIWSVVSHTPGRPDFSLPFSTAARQATPFGRFHSAYAPPSPDPPVVAMHPGQLEQLRRNPELMGRAVEELLRYHTASSFALKRVAKEAVKLDGQGGQSSLGVWLWAPPVHCRMACSCRAADCSFYTAAAPALYPAGGANRENRAVHIPG